MLSLRQRFFFITRCRQLFHRYATADIDMISFTQNNEYPMITFAERRVMFVAARRRHAAAADATLPLPRRRC